MRLNWSAALGIAMIVCALAGTTRFAIDHVDRTPPPGIGTESVDIAALDGLPRPSRIEPSFAVARMPLAAVVLWPVARATNGTGVTTALRILALAAFALAFVIVALTVRELGGGWIAAGFAAIVLAAASSLREALMVSPFEAVSLSLAAALWWVTARTIRGRGSQRLMLTAVLLLVLCQPLAAGAGAIALWITARARNWPRILPLLPLAVAVVLFAGFTVAGFEPLGRAGLAANTGVRSLDAVLASLQGELREAVENAWDSHALGAVVFVALLGIGLAGVRPGFELVSRRVGGTLLAAMLAYFAVFVPAYVIAVYAAGGDVPASDFFVVNIGLAVMSGLSLEAFRHRMGLHALVGLGSASILLIPLFGLTGLG